MTAPASSPRLTAAELMRRHIKAMRDYATSLVPALGPDNPIVQRIQNCATSNEWALDRIEERSKPQPTCCPCHRPGVEL